jgi:hypothetical protein
MNIMRVAGVITMIGIAALLILLKARNATVSIRENRSAATPKTGGAVL